MISISPPRKKVGSAIWFTTAISSAILVFCLFGLQLFSGCGDDSGRLSPQSSPGGFAMNLIMPPAGIWPDSAVPADTTFAWIYRLGTSDDAPFTERPDPFDPNSDTPPFASGFAVGDREFQLDIVGELSNTWFRLFVAAGDFRGSSTFRIDGDETEREVFVALAPFTATSFQLVVFDGLPVSSLAPITQAVFGDLDEKALFTLFPVALANPEPIESLEFIFCLDNATGVELYIDPGSRLFSAGDENEFTADLLASSHSSPNGDSFTLTIEPTAGPGSGATVAAGSGILFYLLATADDLSSALCLDRPSVLFKKPGSDPFQPAIPQSNSCAFPVGLTIDVTAPRTDDLICDGFPQTIAWTLADGWDNQMKLELLRDGSVCGNPISTTTEPGALFFDWIVAACDGEGGAFQIQLTPLGEIGIGGMERAVSESFLIRSGCDLALTAPNGGESYLTGAAVEIAWEGTQCCGDSVAIVLYGCDQQCLTITSATANDGEFTWFAALCGGGSCDYRIGIQSLDGTLLDDSDAVFMIENACTIRLTSPAALDTWVSGQEQEITWTHQDACGEMVDIQLLRAGEICLTIASETENDGTYQWDAAQCAGAIDGYKITVIDLESDTAGISEGQFQILDPCAVFVTSPNGGESLTAGTDYPITWSTTGGCDGLVDIDLLSDGETCVTIAAGAPDTGTYSWTAAQCDAQVTGYRVRVTDLGSGANDVSDEFFDIEPALIPCAIQVIAPDGGEVLSIDQITQITWNSEETCADQVQIDLLRAGNHCLTINQGTENTGSYDWVIAQCDLESDRYQISVTDTENGVADTSDAEFQITPSCVITLLSPAPETTWCVGRQGNITWQVANCIGGNLNIELLLNGELCRHIASVPAANGTLSWGVIPCEGESGYTIRIRQDASDTETVSEPLIISDTCTLALTSMNDGGAYCEGDSLHINWTAGPCCGEAASVVLYRDQSAVRVISPSVTSPGTVTWVAEQINGPAGAYTIVITDLANQSTVESAQPFTIDPPCALNVTSPAGGAELCEGETVAITWDANTCCGDLLMLELANTTSGDCAVIGEATTDTGRFDWTVAGCDDGQTGGYQIKATSLNAQGEPQTAVYSAGEFSISTDCLMTLVYPEGGEEFAIGDSVSIVWAASACCGDEVAIQLVESESGARRTLGVMPASDGAFDWIAQQINNATGDYYIEIIDSDTETVASNESPFTVIHPCFIELLTSFSERELCTDDAFLIEWEALDCDNLDAVIELLQNEGEFSEIIATVEASDGEFSWLPTQLNSETFGYSLTIEPQRPGVGDLSDGDFSIHDGCAINLTYPTTEEWLCDGEEITIRWTRGECCGTSVAIDLYRNEIFCESIATSVNDSLWYNWTVASCDESWSGFRIRVTDTSSLTYSESEIRFDVVHGGEFYSPSAGFDYVVGTDMQIQWSAPCTDNPIQIELWNYNFSDAEPCEILATSTPNDGSFNWTIERCTESDDFYFIVLRDPVLDEALAYTNGTFSIVSSNIWYVNADGSGDVATIQQALDLAENGDKIRLGNGTFVGVGNRDLDFLGKAITLESANGDPINCVINCQNLSRGISFTNDETATSLVQNIRITNGDASPSIYGGAILCEGASPTISGCIIDKCFATNYGGGISCQASSPIIHGCTFYANEALSGSAIYTRLGSNPVVTNSIFTAGVNSAFGDDESGGVSLDCCCNHDPFKAAPPPDRDANNFNADPLMCWPDDGGSGFRLQSDSPCTAANQPLCGQIGACPPPCPGVK